MFCGGIPTVIRDLFEITPSFVLSIFFPYDTTFSKVRFLFNPLNNIEQESYVS